MFCCSDSSATTSAVKAPKKENNTQNAPKSNQTQKPPSNNDSNKQPNKKSQGIYQSRIKDHNIPNPINDEDQDDTDYLHEESDDKVAPLPSTQNAPTFHAEVHGVQWSNLFVDPEPGKIEKAIIGHGSFGTVVKASLKQSHNDVVIDEATQEKKIVSVVSDVDVAVKVLTRSQTTMVSEKEFQKVCEKAFQEVQILQEAETKMLYRDCIIRTYGIARGPLPDTLCTVFGMKTGTEGVGIVMRYEGGGSLEDYLSKQRSLGEKLRILEGIARGLSELHGIGIIHADIKPENILLSEGKPPEVRLADFGLSVLRDKSLTKSSLVATTHSRGTPIYFAPEMLMNPYQVVQRKVIAQSSRKTDIYAFGLLSWEVLTQNQAFFDVDTEGELCAKVHKGQRPPIDQIPRNCPHSVINTVKACWDTNRNRRKTAVECMQIYQYCYGIVSRKKFDIFFSHDPKKLPISTMVMQHLIRLGYRVWYDQDESDAMTSERQNRILDGIARSTVVISYSSRAYQENMKCMFELKEARTMNPPKPIVTLAAEQNLVQASSKLFLDLSKIQTIPFADVSGITADYFDLEDVQTGEKLLKLQQMLQPVMTLLRDNGCFPALDVLAKIAD